MHFRDRELYWECRATQTCECGEPWQSTAKYKYTSESLKCDLPRNLGTDERAQADNLRQWQELVQEYTRLDITHPSDAFPALQAIATKWQRPAAGDYLAGLWRTNLVQGLLWRSELAGDRLKTYRAPTWSWASIHGWVDWWPDILRKEYQTATILSASTTPVGQDPRGEILAGSITIRGCSILGKVLHEGSHEYYRPGNVVLLQASSDTTDNGPKVGAGMWYPDVVTHVETGSEVLLMQIVELQDRGDWITFFIAFRRKLGEEVLYERVGCARTELPGVRCAFRDFGQEMVIVVV
jgi:hypothetical protein